MLRWIETSVFLPLMRVHGYMSNTEPWNYGSEAQSIIAGCLQERYRLLPYIYSMAAAISFDGSTLMRPLVFDFADDTEALGQKYEYMFGPALLVSPVTEQGVTSWKTYLPKTQGGWYDYYTGQHYDGGQTVTTTVIKTRIPVFARAGSIIPVKDDEVLLYPGADGTFMLYEDDGSTRAYEQSLYSRITFQWDDTRHRLTISKRMGKYQGMAAHRTFRIKVAGGGQTTINYQGKKTTLDIQ
jgi:alpha-D-xyloside xylohydrolase